jgi:DNA polymerase III epsilon subunit-like protein
MVKILAFDTETSDIPINLPSIIQLGYVLYDTIKPSNTKIFNKYIDISDSDNIVISKKSSKIHHITNAFLKKLEPKYKMKINDAIYEFMKDVSKANVIVGHNVDFDRQMIIAELLKLKLPEEKQFLEKMLNDDMFKCTMILTKPICKLQMKIKTKYIIKSPKLIEAYSHFFGYKPKNELLHNALIDAIICLRVYCMCLKKPIDIYGTNDELTRYIDMI